ncbi:putative aromatic desulfoglucosinolate sulfotransferase [Helianthus annuus]|nr:putative aromatic desulfoglucosinolate sulfotransferase [Helianthus annuus]
MFHFANKLRDKSRGLLTFEETFELFSKGIMPTGPYWDHVKGDLQGTWATPSREEEAKGAVEGIVKLCSFENLSEVNMHGNIREDIPNDAFFREGKVGEWTNHLTDEMSSILDEITKEKFYGLDITWNNPIC